MSKSVVKALQNLIIPLEYSHIFEIHSHTKRGIYYKRYLFKIQYLHHENILATRLLLSYSLAFLALCGASCRPTTNAEPPVLFRIVANDSSASKRDSQK